MKNAKYVLMEGHYECLFDWGTETKCQCCKENIIDEGSEAFFEAYTKTSAGFIRGVGNTIEDAETSAWEEYQRVINCTGHVFERGKDINGGGTCTKCGLYKYNAFLPLTKCVICSTPANYIQDDAGNIYCEKCKDKMPEDLKPLYIKNREKREKRLNQTK